MTAEKPVWAKWRVMPDGSIAVVATYPERDGYSQRELTFASLDEASQTLGASFREVVESVRAAGLDAGRWRP